MPKVVLSIPKLGVKPGGFEKNKEIYVMSFSADLRAADESRLPEVIAAYNETLPNVMPEIANQALLKYVLMAVSNTFQRIRPDQPVSLTGSGILLYPHLDPKGLLANHFVILEDDEGKRRLGKLLENLFSNANQGACAPMGKQFPGQVLHRGNRDRSTLGQASEQLADLLQFQLHA